MLLNMIKKTAPIFFAYLLLSALANYLVVYRFLGIASQYDVQEAWVFLFLIINMLFIPIFMALMGISYLSQDANLAKVEAIALLAMQTIFILDFRHRIAFILVASGILLVADVAYLWRLMRKSSYRILHVNPFHWTASGAARGSISP